MEFKELKQLIADDKVKTIYYSTKTVWWTHDEKDVEEATIKGKKALSRNIRKEIKPDIPEGQKKVLKAHLQSLKDTPIPFDPFGSPLYKMDAPKEYIKQAEENPDHFGKHRLDSLMLGHHKNSTGKAFRNWQEVSSYIDMINVDSEEK